MKILLVCHFPLIGSGSGFYTKNIAENLTKFGHSVYIVAPENTTQIEEIPGIIFKPVYFKNNEEISNALPFNFPCFTTHPRSNITFNDLNDEQLEMYKEKFKSAIEKAIKEFKPDIIHSGHIWILSDIVSGYCIPTVITSHETDMIGYNKWKRFHKYCEKAVEKCNKIITISKSNNEEVIKAFPKAKEKVVQLQNGYDQSIFYKKEYNKKEILNKIGVKQEFKKIVLFSGKLVHIKGIDILLKAAKKYENENTLTIIAGDGILKKDLKKQAKDLELKNIIFVGNQSQENLNKLYNIADVLAVPSRVEGFGLVAIEALACGTPVVATNQGGMTDFINEDVGALVDVENDVELEKEISKILNEEKEFDREQLAKYARDNYSQSLLIDKVIKIYESCL